MILGTGSYFSVSSVCWKCRRRNDVPAFFKVGKEVENARDESRPDSFEDQLQQRPAVQSPFLATPISPSFHCPLFCSRWTGEAL